MYSETAKLLQSPEAVGKETSVNIVLNLASRNEHQRVLKLFLDMKVVKLILNISASNLCPDLVLPTRLKIRPGQGQFSPTRLKVRPGSGQFSPTLHKVRQGSG